VQNLAQSSVSILRGTAPNAYGDLVPSGTAVYASVPAAIAETSRTVSDPATQAPRTVRAITCVMPGWADVLASDQLLDQATGLTYAIESVTAQPSLGYPPDKVLTLRRVTGTGT
jgi:hypothetical protein